MSPTHSGETERAGTASRRRACMPQMSPTVLRRLAEPVHRRTCTSFHRQGSGNKPCSGLGSYSQGGYTRRKGHRRCQAVSAQSLEDSGDGVQDFGGQCGLCPLLPLHDGGENCMDFDFDPGGSESGGTQSAQNCLGHSLC